MTILPPRSVFNDATQDTLDLIEKLNRSKKHTFLIPTKFISAECGQVAYLLDTFINHNKATSKRRKYRTFFANSRFEALEGAFKIARHKKISHNRKHSKPIVVYDPTGELCAFVDPLRRGTEKALIPGIRIVSELADLDEALVNPIAPLAVAIRSGSEVQADSLAILLERCRKAGAITILEQSDLDLTSRKQLIHQMQVLPDIVVTGESLTNHEIPFGAFSMTVDVHEPWASLETCFLHSSTYAGNTLALTRARDLLLAQAPGIAGNEAALAKCSAIGMDNGERLKAFARYVNPGLVNLYALTGLDIKPTMSHGAKLTIELNNTVREEITDCVSGGGVAARGHTPRDIVPEVIARHEPDVDYWDELKTQFKSLGWPHAFPAVSGATAVDIAMILSMLSAGKKTKIVIFSENYAGKTLLSLIGSEESTARTPFFPLYHDVCYIDPFSTDAEVRLEKVLCSGEIALVWFEMLQGATTHAIPEKLVQLINRHKKSYGYRIGVDEIFMGLFRVDRLFGHTGLVEEPDIVTLAKPLADATFPFAVVLVGDSVYRQAHASRPAVVGYLETLYLNQLGSHIASHALQKILAPDFETDVKEVSRTLSRGFRNISDNSHILKDVKGRGHFYQLVYNLDSVFFKLLGEKGSQMFMLYMCNRCLRQGKAFLFFDRCIPSLTLTKEEAGELLANLTIVFEPKQTVTTYLNFSFFVLRALLFLIKESAHGALSKMGIK